MHTVYPSALVHLTFVAAGILLYHTGTMQVLTFTGQLLSKAQELQQQADHIVELQRVFK